ncbi:MAG: hypothetical protein RIS35_638 [Pseudomonadota bacterium]|jgi:hypothetical protein
MRFARPPDGFKLKISDSLAAYVAEWVGVDERRRWVWDAILARVTMVGAREGIDLGANRFMMVFKDLPAEGCIIRISYTINGDTLQFVTIFLSE